MYNNSKMRFLISPVIVFCILVIVFIVNGIYPFGSNTIINGDFGKAYVPVYYYIYDVLTGNANVFMNFKVGMGSNMFDLTSVYGILSPVNWLILFTSRSNIPYFLSFMLVIRLCLCSVTSFLLFDKCYKNLDLFWKVLFSVFYGLSLYNIVYYTNFVWLDNVILFPLILLGIKNIRDKNSFYLYSVVLFLSLCFSFYISYMELLFVLFLSFFYVIFLLERRERGKFIVSLGIGTLLGIGLSLVFVGPVILQVFSSSRLIEDTGEILLFNFTVDKVMIVLGYGVPIVIFALLLFSKMIDSRIKKFFGGCLLLICIGVILDPINLMWHTGSYKMFPFRYGFIVVMFIYLGALYYLTWNPKLSFKWDFNFNGFIIVLFMILVVIGGGLVYICSVTNPSIGILNRMHKVIAFLISIISVFLAIYICFVKSFMVKKILVVMLFLVSCFSFSLGYIRKGSLDVAYEDTEVAVFDVLDLYEFLDFDDNGFNRYKSLDGDLINNYSFITDTSSIASWKMVDGSAWGALKKLGYDVSDKLTDQGGTLFSDNLLGITKYFSRDYVDSDVFKMVYGDDDYKLYELNNYLGYGFLYNDFSLDREKFVNSIDYQNYIYRKLFSQDDDILEDVTFKVKGSDDGNICDGANGGSLFLIEVKEKSYLYFDYGSLSEDKIIKSITVNGNALKNVKVSYEDNTMFDSEDGIVNLGVFENEVVEVVVNSFNNGCIYDYEFASLNLEKLDSFLDNVRSDVSISQEGNSLVIRVSNDNDMDNLFLPLNYLNGYEGMVNGNRREVSSVLDNFVSIKLDSGGNYIVLTYYPPMFIECAVVSGISLLLFGCSFLFRFNRDSKILERFCSVIYYGVVGIMFFVIYVYGFIRMF